MNERNPRIYLKEQMGWPFNTLLCFFLMLLTSAIQAQEMTKVATQTFDESVEWNANDTLKLIGEKSSMYIEGWDREYIRIQIKFISRHPDEAVAVRELSYLHYDLTNGDGWIELGNYFLSDEGYEKVKGLLSVEYTVSVPHACPLHVQNQYGSMSLSQLDREVSLKSKFTDIRLDQITGVTRLSCDFGTIDVSRIQGLLYFDLNRVVFKSEALSAEIKGKAVYGSLAIDQQGYLPISITGKRTAVSIALSHTPTRFNYDLQTSAERIYLPFHIDASRISKYHHIQHEKSPWIKIGTSYSTISVTHKNPDYASH